MEQRQTAVATRTENEQIVREAFKIRLSQVLINEEYKAGKFKIPVHLAMGHEAIAIAVSRAMGEKDKLVLSHRNMAYNLVRLGKVQPILDEYLLKPTGLMGGRLGSMNVINPERGIIYASSILGNNFSVSTGIAMAEKLKQSGAAVFMLGGDGSIEEGSFWESLLFAKTLGLGLLFVIENNEWSLGTHISERRVPIHIEQLASSLDIPYLKLEGNHIHKYIEVLQGARERAIKENLPVCIEVIVKTLGDRLADDGHYINYHAGPAPTVNLNTIILKENEDDPLFVLEQEIGKEKFMEIARDIMRELKAELA